MQPQVRLVFEVGHDLIEALVAGTFPVSFRENIVEKRPRYPTATGHSAKNRHGCPLSRRSIPPQASAVVIEILSASRSKHSLGVHPIEIRQRKPGTLRNWELA